MARANANLTRDEAAYLRRLAEFHGITASSGPYRGQGSAFALQLALAHGDFAVVSSDPDDRQALARWLRDQAPAAPAHLAELIVKLAAELIYGLDTSPLPAGEPGQSSGPINTLEG